MTISSFMVVLLIFLLAGLIILRPILVESEPDQTRSIDLDPLLAERERLFSAILDLDQAHELQKIPEAEYKLKRENLQRQAAGVLKLIDERSHSGTGTPKTAGREQRDNRNQ